MKRTIRSAAVITEAAFRKPTRSYPAIACFLLTLPHFAVPGGLVYRPPAASIALLVWAVLAIVQNKNIRIRLGDPAWLRQPLFLFFGYCVLSTVYGYWLLDESNRLVLHLKTGDVDYLGAAAERLLQLLLVIVAFEVVRGSRYRPEQLMRWWLNSCTLAVAIHALTYFIISAILLQRAGTFPEGNVAGLYYLISVFVAFEYRSIDRSFRGLFYLLCAITGIFLCRSSAAIVLVVLLTAVRYALLTRHVWQRGFRLVVMMSVVLAVGAALIARGLDFGIGEKLFEQEVTATSFSRIDRLASIDAGYKLFRKSPIFGNGLQSYAFLSNDLLSGPLLNVYEKDYRRIPNNIYLEILSELGLVGMVIFGLIILRLLSISWQVGRSNQQNLFCGLLGILFYWNAFPTYTVLFVWVFLGLIARGAAATSTKKRRNSGPLAYFQHGLRSRRVGG